MNLYLKILDLLTKPERYKAFMLLVMILLMAFLDTLSVASVMPFIAVLSNPEIVSTNVYLQSAYVKLGFVEIRDFQFFLGVVFFLMLVTSIGFKALTTWFMVRFIYIQQYSLTRRLVEHYLRQPYEWFLNRHSADLGKSVLSEVDQVITETLMPSLNLIAQIFLVIALFLLLVIVDPLLVFSASLFFLIIYGGIYALLRRRLSRVGEDRVRANRMRFSVLLEAFGGIKDIKIYGLEDIFVARFDEPALRFAKNKSFAQIAAQLPRFFMEVLVFGGILLLILVMTQTAKGFEDVLPVISLYTFAGYRLMPAMQQIYGHFSILRFSRHALDNLHGELTSFPTRYFHCRSQESIDLEREIIIDNVEYRYPGAKEFALNGISFKIPSRSTVGLVGATGSGKTTLVDFMLGLLEPQKGQLLVDGKSITRENCAMWQKNIGYVPQNIYLSDDTVASNIAFGVPKEEIIQADVERAARIANLHDFVCSDLPQGYNTHVGERGVRLSGGQRQRIGIARALYRKPQILVLDEATSALDNLTERAVMDAVHNLSHQITIVIVAHRLSTVKECNIIFFFDKGRLESQGSFDELVSHNSRFSLLVNASSN